MGIVPRVEAWLWDVLVSHHPERGVPWYKSKGLFLRVPLLMYEVCTCAPLSSSTTEASPLPQRSTAALRAFTSLVCVMP